jgi:two-component system cell cycle sensor histidine kinase/response regulator CckA
VRSHRGLLKVKSVPGRGSAFRVYFPVMQEAVTPVAKAETGGCVLIVDDEPIVRQIVKVALERTGRTVLSAGSGEAAIETLRKSGDLVSLVLLDWKMPGMDGEETLGRLREIAPDVKVIVSSGFEQREAEERFQGSGISGFLQKPYKMSELAALVEYCLGLRARSA